MNDGGGGDNDTCLEQTRRRRESVGFASGFSPRKPPTEFARPGLEETRNSDGDNGDDDDHGRGPNGAASKEIIILLDEIILFVRARVCCAG